MKIAVQMDHVSKLSIKGDTTLALCLEAQKRKFKLCKDWYWKIWVRNN